MNQTNDDFIAALNASRSERIFAEPKPKRTSTKKARNLRDIKKHPMVIDVYKDSDGYWIHLQPNYICTESECGTIHERTIKDVLMLFNNCVIQKP